MKLVTLKDIKLINYISKLHHLAYQEKFGTIGISNNFDDYLRSTINDIVYRKVYITSDLSGFIVCEDKTDNLIVDSTYHLITRIYVIPQKRGYGIAKAIVKDIQSKLGRLMGYNGKFYKLKEIL